MNDHIHLKLAIKCLSSVGFWPLQFEKTPYRIMYSVYFAITITVFVLLVTGEFVDLYLNAGKSIEQVSILMGLNLFHFLGLIKVWVISGDRVVKLRQKIFTTEQNILTNADEKVKAIYLKYVRQNHSCNRLMVNMAISCVLFYCIFPYLSEVLNPPETLYDVVGDELIVYRARPLPLVSWFPFDRYKYYGISYSWHVIALILVPAYIIGCNIFFYGLIIFAVGQLKILQQHLIEVRQKLKDDRNEVIAERLRCCVVYHKAIIVYMHELSDAMKIFLLMDFVACGLQIAVLGFQTAVMDFSLQLLQTVSYLLTMLLQLFLLYWFANEALLESVNVVNAIWNTNWYDCNEAIKQALLIVMLRVQKPLTLSVGPFYHMSTETMVAIMRAGYSYAMLMRRIYSK